MSVNRPRIYLASQSPRRRELRTCPVLAADTTVTLDGKIIGKPDNNEDAA